MLSEKAGNVKEISEHPEGPIGRLDSYLVDNEFFNSNPIKMLPAREKIH